MRAIHRLLCLGVAGAVLAGPSGLACASPGGPAPFVPAVDPEAVPGFRLKMRGERVVYCRCEVKIGTRFRTETCIDQARMPAYLAALEENRQALRSIRTGENRIN